MEFRLKSGVEMGMLHRSLSLGSILHGLECYFDLGNFKILTVLAKRVC